MPIDGEVKEVILYSWKWGSKQCGQTEECQIPGKRRHWGFIYVSYDIYIAISDHKALGTQHLRLRRKQGSHFTEESQNFGELLCLFTFYAAVCITIGTQNSSIWHRLVVVKLYSFAIGTYSTLSTHFCVDNIIKASRKDYKAANKACNECTSPDEKREQCKREYMIGLRGFYTATKGSWSPRADAEIWGISFILWMLAITRRWSSHAGQDMWCHRGMLVQFRSGRLIYVKYEPRNHLECKMINDQNSLIDRFYELPDRLQKIHGSVENLSN